MIFVIGLLAAISAIYLLYRLFLNESTLTALSQLNNPALALGISAITIASSMFVIMEILVSLLKLWREDRNKKELIKIIDAQSLSPKGMDIFALERETKLPRKILLERINELILLGRIGVKITTNNQREYFLN
jgi:hypothetical protein